jgi:uncharacterized protein (TIGR00251 family)
MLNIRTVEDGVIFLVRVQPRAAKSGIREVVDGKLKLRLTSPPVEGAANEDCILLLADFFKVPRSRVSILHGKRSREKKIKIEGVTVDTILRRLL